MNILMIHNAGKLNFVTFQSVDPEDFLPLLNNSINRRHLIEHDAFNAITLRKWLDNKLVVDASPGCRIRAIMRQNNLVGWCGIQGIGDDYELAAVIDHAAWDIGHTVLKLMLEWADELGHDYVLVHLLKTRPKTVFLKGNHSMSMNVNLMDWGFTRIG